MGEQVDEACSLGSARLMFGGSNDLKRRLKEGSEMVFKTDELEPL